MKGVILAGGFGTRLRPYTLRFNKGMAPIYSPDGAIPQLFYPLKTLVNSGIDDILIITSREHCGQIVELLGDGTEYGCHLTYKIQEMNRPVVGIAQALSLSKNFVGDSAFAVILGDNFYENTFKTEFNEFDSAYKKGKYGIASVFLKSVHDPETFGVATLNERLEVTNIVEKPENPKTDYAVTGLYLYTPYVFELVPQLKPSQRNELEITDINNHYVKEETDTLKAHILLGYWHDMGLPESAKSVQDYLWELKK